jgi:protein-S-isoprenylcysteine O-methyltransferase Ste14
MKITGVAPKIAIPTFSYIIITIIIDHLVTPLFDMTQSNHSTIIIFGIILILIGIIIVANVGKKLLKSFKSNILMTDGLYKIIRNPMYAAYLIFIIPGIALLFNSWLVLTSIIVNYILFHIFIREEYKYLEDKYGEEYKKYLSKVWVKFL